MNFEQYLINKGYCKKVYDFKTFTLKDACKYDILSTMGHTSFIYVKDNSQIVWGLHEINKPPTLISPRPHNIITDDEMNSFILNHSNDELYNLICKTNTNT